MIAITGATGRFGRIAIEHLLKHVPPARIVAAVRAPQKAIDLAQRGVHVRVANYDRPETLRIAFEGVEKLLLVSGSEVGRRLLQHKAVIEAARAAGVELLAYTSILHAETSPIELALEHRQTESALKASGLPHVLLRNAWYVENLLGAIPAALQHGVLLGSAGTGRISCASRADYAEAAAAVLLSAQPQAGRIYELAGGTAFTQAELAAEVARQSGRRVDYQCLPEQDYKAALMRAGMSAGFAALVAQADAAAAHGALFGSEPDLERLIGRPTTTLQQAVAKALPR